MIEPKEGGSKQIGTPSSAPSFQEDWIRLQILKIMQEMRNPLTPWMNPPVPPASVWTPAPQPQESTQLTDLAPEMTVGELLKALGLK